MALRIFRSTNRSTWAENAFFDNLVEKFKNTPYTIALLTDVYINGTQFDCVLLSENGVVIYEHKNYSGVIKGSENGEWTLVKIDNSTHIINRGRENPFEQTRRQRFMLMDLIKANFDTIFPTGSQKIIQTSHIAGRLVFSQLSDGSEIKRGKSAKYWFDVIDAEKVVEDFLRKPPGSMTFTNETIDNFVKLLDLREVLDGVEPEKATTSFCPICAYSETDQQCDVKHLQGQVTDLNGPILTISSNEHNYTVYYEKESSFELDLIRKIYEYLSTSFANFPLDINLMHLSNKDEGLSLTESSLIIILPAWTYSVTDFAQLDFCKRQVITKNYSLSPSNKSILRGTSVGTAFEAIVNDGADSDKAVEMAQMHINASKVEYITSGADAEEIDQQIQDETEKLIEWSENRELNGSPRTEAFIISTMLGLKGKIDLVVEGDDGKITDIIELKSSKPDWKLGSVKQFHLLQVGAYALMAIVKQEERLELANISVLYSQAPDFIEKIAPLRKETFVDICSYRNLLLYAEFFDTLPDFSHPMPYHNGCLKCGALEICMNLCRSLQFHACYSDCFKHPENWTIPVTCKLETDIDDIYIDRFKEWRDYLKYQKLRNFSEYSSLLKMNQKDVINLGKLLIGRNASIISENTESSDFVYEIEYDRNTSEFRAHDIVLLSDEYDLSVSRQSNSDKIT
jgi:CRISPR/Cas system-associated exonuclease Cas4 (RecB family)